MLASPGPLPAGPDTALTWAFEIKWDGMRVLATVLGDRFRLASRTGRDVTDRFPEVAAARSGQPGLPAGSVLDRLASGCTRRSAAPRKRRGAPWGP